MQAGEQTVEQTGEQTGEQNGEQTGEQTAGQTADQGVSQPRPLGRVGLPFLWGGERIGKLVPLYHLPFHRRELQLDQL